MLGTLSPFSVPRSCLWLWTWWVCTWSTATTTWFLCCKILEGCNRGGGTCTFVHGWMFQVVSKDHFVKQSLHHWVAQQAGFGGKCIWPPKKTFWTIHLQTFGFQNVCSFPGCFFRENINQKHNRQGTNISRFQGTFKDDFPLPQVGYVSSLEG